MVVDFCAGAGGKTLALGAQMRNTGRLYAFDVSGHRLAELKPRLARSGLSNVHPAQIAHERDARVKRLAGKVDRVLVDAPCTGLGTLRRNPDLKWRQTPEALAALAESSAPSSPRRRGCVKPGGRLVYATCSRCSTRRTRTSPRRSTPAPGPAFIRLPVLEPLQRAQVAGPRRSSAATTCACGRIGTATTASSPRPGSDACLTASGAASAAA